MITMDDSVRFEDFGLYVQEGHIHPETPTYVRKTTSIPGRPGVWDFGEDVGERPPLVFPLGIIEERNIMQSELRRLKSFLYDGFGKPRVIKIVYDYEPDKLYLAKCITEINPFRFATLAEFNIEFQTVDPYKYSNVSADEVVWGSESIDFMADYLLGHTNDFAGGTVKVTENRTLNITTSGIAVQPTIKIDGTANNLKIKSGQHEISLPNFSNTKWEIDLERYVVYRSNQETMIDLNKFYLMPGNNEIAITGTNLNIDVGIKFNDKYI